MIAAEQQGLVTPADAREAGPSDLSGSGWSTHLDLSSPDRLLQPVEGLRISLHRDHQPTAQPSPNASGPSQGEGSRARLL